MGFVFHSLINFLIVFRCNIILLDYSTVPFSITILVIDSFHNCVYITIQCVIF